MVVIVIINLIILDISGFMSLKLYMEPSIVLNSLLLLILESRDLSLALFIYSSQSRADLLTLGLAVTNVLNGLVWLSIRPKYVSVVRLL